MNVDVKLSSILECLDIERSAFESLLAQVHPAQRDAIPVQDDWTVKDILAHISAWELELLRWLEMAKAGEPPDIPAPGYWASYIGQYNAQAYARNRDRPLADVEREFQEIFARLREVMESLPEDPTDPVWSVWYGGTPPWQLLAEYYKHYEEHAVPIRNWLQSAQTRLR